MSVLRLDRVTKRYPGMPSPAVRDLSLSLRQGEIFTLLGPSGCGKTTVLRLIAGFERPDAGEVWVGGRRVAGAADWVPPERRGVGMVFQDYALFPHLSVAENVAFGLHRCGARERQGALRRTLELVGLRGLEARYPHELSGGQQQRVALARALAPSPSLILLDEPFSNLDASLRLHIGQELRQILRRSGTTALMVMHDQKDALALSDRMAVMRQGAIMQEGTPREVYQAPRSLFVAQFLGQTNILTGIWRNGTVETELGPLACQAASNRRDGSRVILSVRPDSFEVCPDGPLRGRVESVIYGGSSCQLRVSLLNGRTAGGELLIHCHPEAPVREGDTIRFKALPDFAAIVD